VKGFLAGRLLVEAGARLGIPVTIEPEFGYVGRIALPDGRVSYFRNTNFDLNGQGSAEIARDKAYAAAFLAQRGYRVPEGQTFFAPRMLRWSGATRDAAAAQTYARGRGYPVIVKPNNGSQGRGVARVYNGRELAIALRAIFARENVALVQPPAPGDDYRFVVLDDTLVCAYRRRPLAVVGDGAASIGALLERKHAAFAASGRDTTVPLGDPRIAATLRRQGRDLATVPPPGERVELLANANLSTGGEAVDVTGEVHPAMAALAIGVTRALGLRHSGVDVLTPDPISGPPGRYVVLEANPAPGLDHYAHLGPEQYAVVAALYERILRAIVGL